jgi:hypothetical protein
LVITFCLDDLLRSAVGRVGAADRQNAAAAPGAAAQEGAVDLAVWIVPEDDVLVVAVVGRKPLLFEVVPSYWYRCWSRDRRSRR